MTQYDEFKDYMERSSVTEKSLKVFNSTEDPDAKVVTRRNLEGLINNTIPHLNINIRSPEALVNDAGIRVRDRYDRLGFEKFSEDKIALINTAKASSGDNFKNRYLTITPYEIVNNDTHNAIAGVHSNFTGLREVIKNYNENPKAATHRQFIAETLPYIDADIQGLLGNDPEGLGDLAKQVYVSASPHEAEAVAHLVLGSIKGRLDRALPEDQRADYVERTLKARAIGSDEDAKIAAKDIYKLVA